VESVIYVVSGRARMRWGEKLEFMAEAGPGDLVVNLDIPVVEQLEEVHWVDNIHPAPKK
jgi:uncharacterized RmlC-like cupin family protein